MPETTTPTTPLWVRLLVGLLCLVLIAAHVLTGRPVLTDAFHFGEYFAVAVGFISDTRETSHGLTIHGLLDFAPAQLAAAVWGDDRHFFPTFATYKLLSVVAGVLFVLLVRRLSKDLSYSLWLVVGAAVLAPHVVGYREVVLLCGLMLFVTLTRDGAELRRAAWVYVVFGLVMAFNVFWSYDRGIAGGVALGLAALYLALSDRRWLFAIAAFAIAGLGLQVVSDAFSLTWYIGNVLTLVETSSNWAYPWSLKPALLTLFAVAFTGAALIPTSVAVLRSGRNSRDAGLFIGLALLSLIMLKVGINRADMSHILKALWLPVLISVRFGLGCFGVSRMVSAGVALLVAMAFVIALYFEEVILVTALALLVYPQIAGRTEGRGQKIALRMFVAIVAVLAVSAGHKQMRKDRYDWIAAAVRAPVNATVAPEGNVWAAQEIVASGSDCVFDMSNNGLINGLAKLPSCTRFTYPVYAGPRHEAAMIAELASANPAVVVYSAEFWSYSIDKRPMSERFATLDAYLTETWPVLDCNFGYCLRRR